MNAEINSCQDEGAEQKADGHFVWGREKNLFLYGFVAEEDRVKNDIRDASERNQNYPPNE